MDDGPSGLPWEHTYLVVENGGPSTISRINGRINLDGQQVRSPVGVLLRLHPGNNPNAHRDVVAPRWISNHGDRVLQLRDAAKL